MKPERNGQADIEIRRHDVGGRHWYEVIEVGTRQRIKWLASVTHYTSQIPKGEFFNKWLADTGWEDAEKIKTQAGERGSNVHVGIDRLIKGDTLELPDFTEEEWLHLRAFANWVEDFKPQFLSTEEIVYDLDQGVAGTLDHTYTLLREVAESRLKIRGLIGDLHVVGDVKSGKNLYEENHLQGNKYGHLHNALHSDNPVSHYSLLRTNSKHKRKYEYVLEPLSEARLQAFDAQKIVVDHIDPATEPTFPEWLPETLKL